MSLNISTKSNKNRLIHTKLIKNNIITTIKLNSRTIFQLFWQKISILLIIDLTTF
jgi:hypothetical protein